MKELDILERSILKYSLRRQFDNTTMQKVIISIAKKLDMDCEFIDELESDYEFELKN